MKHKDEIVILIEFLVLLFCAYYIFYTK